MKTLYQCEICGSLYQGEKEAVDCENNGMPEPNYEKGFKFGVYEVRSRRIKSFDNAHVWCYDVRRQGLDPGIWDYLEFTEKEIEQHL